MTNEKRQQIYDKFSGRCAYTGQPLTSDWQVDHMESQFWCVRLGHDPNKVENLLPTLRIINHYKRSKDLEEFRLFMLSFHKRIAKLPIRSRVDRWVRRKAYMLAIADAFGITPDKPFTGKFYFETLNIPKQQFETAHENKL